MRYDTPVYFQKITPGEYNTATGDYGEPTITETEIYASVMDTRSEMMRLVYNGPMQGSLTIQLQNHYTEPFDRIRVGDLVYKVDYTRRLRVKQTFVVSEAQ